jgi:hypothetical protein
MNGKSFLILCALTLSSLGIASAKSYDLHFNSPTKVGATELKPGDYSLKVEGSQAIFTNEDNRQSVTVPVKVAQRDKKSEYTTVESTNEGGMDIVHSIDLGGSKTALDIQH